MKRLFFPALLLIFLPYRLLFIDDPLKHVNQFRQSQTATVALNFYKNGITWGRTEIDILGKGKERYLTLEFPLYEAIVASLYRLFSVNDMWARLVSVTAGMIAGYFLYRLVLGLTHDRLLAFFSGFFFLVAPINMFHQRDVLIEPTIIATLMAGLYFGVSWITTKQWANLILAIVLLSLGFVQKGMYGPFLLPVLLVLFLRQKNDKQSTILFAALGGVPLIMLFFWQSHVNAINTANGNGYFSTSDPGHVLWNFGTLEDRLSASLWQFRWRNILNGIFLKPGLFLFLIGLSSYWKQKYSTLFYVWISAAVAYFLILFRIQSHLNYQMILVPICAVFMAAGFLFLYRFVLKSAPRFLPRIGIYGGFAILCALLLQRSYASSRWDATDDSAWHGRLMQVGMVVPKDTWGILVNPGNDWNSVYTYFPRLKMKVVPAEHLTPESVGRWHQEGYTYIVLHEYEKYPTYLSEVAPGHSLDFLGAYKEVLMLEDFRVLIL